MPPRIRFLRLPDVVIRDESRRGRRRVIQADVDLGRDALNDENGVVRAIEGIVDDRDVFLLIVGEERFRNPVAVCPRRIFGVHVGEEPVALT